MKLSLSIITLAALSQSALGFAPSATKAFGLSTVTTNSPAVASTTAVFADGDDEEEGFDLNLEEMFDM
jgi:hypothetical protein